MFHEKPRRGKMVYLVRTLLSGGSFTKTPEGKNVSRKPPKGKNGLPSENMNNHDHTHTKHGTTNKEEYLSCGCLILVPVFYSPTFCLWVFFIFCGVREKGKKPLYWREVFGFLHFTFCIEGKFLVPFILLWRKVLVSFVGQRREVFGSLGDRNF